LPEDKLVALFNGIDLSRFDPAVGREARQEVRARFQIAETAIVGLILAQDFERKGVRQAIRALAMVADRRLTLLIGGKPNPAEYRRLGQKLNMQDRGIFSGPVGKSGCVLSGSRLLSAAHPV